MKWSLLALLEVAFAALLAAWCLGVGPGESAPAALVLGFAGYAASAVVIAIGALGTRRWAPGFSIGVGLLYLVPGAWSFATTELWQALSMPPAALMLSNFGAALLAQVLAVATALLLLRQPTSISPP
ncbi:MAG: hypothetical protein ABI742_10075 [Gemmatimonadota bacterium]